jgi:hypothetical protein
LKQDEFALGSSIATARKSQSRESLKIQAIEACVMTTETARRVANIHGAAYDGTSTGRHWFTVHLPDGRSPSFTIDQYAGVTEFFICSQRSEKALPISAKSVQRGELIMNSYQSAPQPGEKADFFWSVTIVCFEGARRNSRLFWKASGSRTNEHLLC